MPVQNNNDGGPWGEGSGDGSGEDPDTRSGETPDRGADQPAGAFQRCGEEPGLMRSRGFCWLELDAEVETERAVFDGYIGHSTLALEVVVDVDQAAVVAQASEKFGALAQGVFGSGC